MARYIDAEKLLSEYLDLSESEFPTASGSLDEFLNNDIPNLIRNFKTEDVQPVVHAKVTDYYCCSNCKYSFDFENMFEINYCPNCGAKLK